MTASVASAYRDSSRTGSAGLKWLWPTLVLALCHAQAIASFQILNILTDPIKASLNLTDTEYSLLQGLAVAIFAAILGIPAARRADAKNRRNVILLGACGWSLATFACAFVANFTEIFMARILMGIGEVFLFPAALSLIADLAPRERLSSAVAVFGSGGPLGAAAALYGGSWVLPHRDQVVGWLPVLSSLEGWRIAFLLCGLTGIATLALLLGVAEPTRGPRSAADGSWRTLRSWLAMHWKAYARVSGGMLCLALCAFATAAWAPMVLTRVHRLSIESAGRLTGGAALLGGALLAYPVGYLVDRLHKAGLRDGVLLVSGAFGFLLAGIAVLGSTVGGSAIVAWVSLYAILGVPTVLAGTALPMMTPASLRAQVMAIHLLLMNLVSLSLGPLIVAVLTERLFARQSAVGASLSLVDAVAACLAAILFLQGRRHFKASCTAL
ncbi:MAG TPA: MFS transporter [Steroidobacteraceae bacterium]